MLRRRRLGMRLCKVSGSGQKLLLLVSSGRANSVATMFMFFNGFHPARRRTDVNWSREGVGRVGSRETVDGQSSVRLP